MGGCIPHLATRQAGQLLGGFSLKSSEWATTCIQCLEVVDDVRCSRLSKTRGMQVLNSLKFVGRH